VSGLSVATFVLVLWAICLAIDVAGVVVAIRLWRLRRAGASIDSRATVYLAITMVVMGFALLGVVGGLVKAFGAVGGESVDPSQKARILAEGISEAMNVTAFATLAATPLAIAVLIYARTRRRADPQRR